MVSTRRSELRAGPDVVDPKKPMDETAPAVAPGSFLGTVLSLSSSSWFPLVVACASFINNFTLVLSGPITAMFMAAVLARPERRYVVAVMNAVGVVCGCAVLVYLVESKGEDWIKSAWPTVFQGDAWEHTSDVVRDYGALGAVLISSAPIVLHPLIVISVLAKMPTPQLLLCILVGRTIKVSGNKSSVLVVVVVLLLLLQDAFFNKSRTFVVF